MSTTPNGVPDRRTNGSVESPAAYETASTSIFRDLRSLVPIWRSVLMQPRQAAFDAAILGASWRRIAIGLALLAVANALGTYLVGLEVGHASVAASGAGSVSLVIGFAIFTGVWYAVGRWFGGRGHVLPYVYLFSLVIVPVGVVTEIVQLIPSIGGVDVAKLFTAVVTAYELYLLIVATAAAQRLPKFRAAIAFLAPFGLLALLLLVPTIVQILTSGLSKA